MLFVIILALSLVGLILNARASGPTTNTWIFAALFVLCIVVLFLDKPWAKFL